MQLHQFVFSFSALILCLGFQIHGFDQFPTSQEAAFYDNHSRQQYLVAYKALERISFEGDEKVLDIGCGSGEVTANVAGRIPQGSVEGIDISKGMIDYARNHYAPYYQNLSFARSDATKLSSSIDFDVIISFNTLHWILDQETLLKCVYDNLSVGGAILFSIPCKPFATVDAVFRRVITDEPWTTYLQAYQHPRRKFTSAEYTQLLEQAGFCDIDVEEVPFTYYFETKTDLADWFAAFSPMLFYIPESERQTFLIAVVDSYLQSFPLEEDGRIAFRQNELIIKACK